MKTELSDVVNYNYLLKIYRNGLYGEYKKLNIEQIKEALSLDEVKHNSELMKHIWFNISDDIDKYYVLSYIIDDLFIIPDQVFMFDSFANIKRFVEKNKILINYYCILNNSNITPDQIREFLDLNYIDKNNNKPYDFPSDIEFFKKCYMFKDTIKCPTLTPTYYIIEFSTEYLDFLLNNFYDDVYETITSYIDSIREYAVLLKYPEFRDKIIEGFLLSNNNTEFLYYVMHDITLLDEPLVLKHWKRLNKYYLSSVRNVDISVFLECKKRGLEIHLIANNFSEDENKIELVRMFIKHGILFSEKSNLMRKDINYMNNNFNSFGTLTKAVIMSLNKIYKNCNDVSYLFNHVMCIDENKLIDDDAIYELKKVKLKILI